MLVLTRNGREPFIKSLALDGKTRQRSALIASSVKRLLRAGNRWGFESQTLKGALKGDYGEIALYEVRCDGRSLIRVMTYLHGGRDGLPVFLFDFDAHKAKRSQGGISPELLAKGERLARIAKELMDHGQGDGYEDR